MSKFTDDEEKDAVDNITNAMFSVDFLSEISDFIFSTNRNSLTVGKFYDKWVKERSLKKDKPPLSLGVILGLMYVALVYGEEWWYDIIPKTNVKDIDDDWGIKHANFKFSKELNPTLEYIIPKLRHALAHKDIKIIVPKNIRPENTFDATKIEFYDRGQDKPFVVLSLNEIFKLIKKFQNFIHKHVREKYGIVASSQRK